MTKISEMQYKYALDRIEVLLPQVDDSTAVYEPSAVELALMSDIVEEYEKEYFPIGKPTVSELIANGLQDKSMSQKELAKELGVSPSRISEYVSGKSEPSLKIAASICRLLDISPAAMMQL